MSSVGCSKILFKYVLVSSQGLEPRLKGPKPFVLPLNDKEKEIRRLQHQERKKGIKIGGHFDYTTTTLQIKCPFFVRIAAVFAFCDETWMCNRFALKRASKRVILRHLDNNGGGKNWY